MDRELQYELVEACRRLSGLGMMPASDGNLSLRSDEQNIIITPSGVRKEQLKPQDLVEVAIESEEASSAASSEWQMHVALYQARQDVQAIVHVHPVYLTAFGLQSEKPDVSYLHETAETVGEIVLIASEEPGTKAFADQVVADLGNAAVGILKNHGAISVGDSLEEALFRMERAEHLAHVLSVVKNQD